MNTLKIINAVLCVSRIILRGIEILRMFFEKVEYFEN